MKHLKTFERFLNEAYKPIPYNVKISGKYEITVVAGFERQDSDNDSLYLMDSDPLRSTIGSLIVKNSDMFKLEKGTKVNATTTKGGKSVKIKRVGDL
jgi:hypothetical protein